MNLNSLIVGSILIAFTSIANSQQSVYSALVPSEGETHMLVSIYERNCEASGWNASLSNAGSSSRGCWFRDGDLVKIKVPTDDAFKTFPFNAFKFMGITRTQQTARDESRKPSTTTLTCAADAWIGDIVVERNVDGTLRSLAVSGEQVSATEQSNSINFSYKGMNISLSTLTGAFNYETSGFQRYLNNRLLGGGSAKGSGLCRVNTSAKQF